MSKNVIIIVLTLRKKCIANKRIIMTIGQKLKKTKTLAQEAMTPEAIAKAKELRKFKDSYIFVNTNFKRKNEPIFALAFCEGERRISLDKNELIFKNDDEIFKIVSNIVKEHYEQSAGKIGIWGNIVNYTYHHSNDKVYVFDKNGDKIESEPIYESKAVLRLKG